MDSILYTDGHGIKVTSNQFITRNTEYLIAGITDARMRLIKASKAPGILFILVGIAGIVSGVMHLFDNTAMEPFYLGSIVITANRLVGIAGLVLILIGIISMVVLKDKYAVHIVTAEGEKDPVVSSRQDYISQIVSALQNALLYK